MDDDEALLDALLGDTVPLPTPASLASPVPPRSSHFTVQIDTKTTMSVIGRRRFGGYEPPQKAIPHFMVPEKPREVRYDLNMERIQLRAKDKRDTRIKKQLKKA